MARRNPAQLQFDALTLEGALLPPEWLAKVAALEAPVQAPADYGIPKGLQLRDEIGRYWRIAEAIWAEFAAARGGADPVGAARRLTRDLLTQAFGFADLAPAGQRVVDGRVFPIAFEALGGRVPVVVGPHTEGMDQSVPRHGDGNRRRSAWGALQEYLNAADGALWGLATNGLQLRLGRDNASMTRPAWLEADLERIFTEQRFADFSVLWLLAHASRFGRADQPVQEAPLERWREAGREEGSRAREALRLGVEDALRALGQGFLAQPANAELRAALASGALSPAEYFNELLRLVYRMIFLLTVEERGILHAPGAAPGAAVLYADGYGMRRLRERALRHTAHDRHGDLWASLRPVFAALGRAEGEPALGLPGLGGLFAADQCPHLDATGLENRALLTAVFRLAWLREGDALARVNWKDMGVEEFGSVYESLLELVPVVSEGGRRFGFAGEGESAGNARKLTGSYYTPDALVQQLLDTALEPVVSQRLAEHPDPKDAERALLSLAVVDPACGSGHFLLAAARRLAGHLARLRAGGTPGAAEYRHALRDVVTHCIHGVDRNPMALELARMALWLEAYTPDCALGFLDHHLVCGDALLGLLDLGVVKDGIPDEAFKALTGDDKDVAKVLIKLNRAGRKTLDDRRKRQDFGLSLGTLSLGEAWAALDALADDRLGGVEAKRAAYARLRAEADTDPRALAADLFVGAFLMPKTLADGERALTEVAARSRFPSTSALVSVLDGTMGADHTVVQAARRACREARVLHWSLAFPQVFARGGFDVVLGNPPWETMSPDRKEFFGRYVARIGELSPSEQDAAIDEILRTPIVADEWEAYCRSLYVAVHYMKESGRYTRYAAGSLGKGDFNVYRQFVELALDAVRDGGYAAQIVPENFYNGANASELRAWMLSRTRLSMLLGFENYRGVWFGEIDSRMKFALYAAQRGGRTESVDVAFGLRSQEALSTARTKPLRLSVTTLRRFAPETMAFMEFANQTEVDICTKMYNRYPPFGNDVEGLPYRNYMRELDMGTNNDLFCLAADGLPLMEGSMVTCFDFRAKRWVSGHGRSALWTECRFGSSDKALVPQWYVRRDQVPASRQDRVGRYRVAYCNVARATDRRCLTAALIPPDVICGDTVPNFVLEGGTAADHLLWLGVANCLVTDFLVRMKIGSHVTVSLLDSMPIPRAVVQCPRGRDVVILAARLSLVVPGMDAFRQELMSDPEFAAADVSPLCDEVSRAEAVGKLNAIVASEVYGLTRNELEYVLDPADILGPSAPETFRALRDQERRAHGEYRTRRLVLEEWDRLFGG